MTFAHRYSPPSGGDSRTLLLLHGTGGDENSLIKLGAMLLPSAGLLSPRGRVLENGMPRFFKRFAEGVFDYDDIKLRANELGDFIAEAAAEYGFDPSKVIAVGYSNGANIGWSTMLVRPETLSGAVLFRPMATLTDIPLPDLSGKRIFVSSGERDPIVPRPTVETLVSQMRSAGADLTMHWEPGGHELGPDELELAREWLAAQV